MKEAIHPTFYPDALFTCGSCGTTWHTGSTKKEVHVDICSNCHPFFTGTQRIVDTAGQVERFTKRMAARETAVETGQVKGSKKQRRAQERAKRSGMLEASSPEPEVEAVADAVAVLSEEPAGTETAAEATQATQATQAPRERKPRPPRERKPREPKADTAESASAAPAASEGEAPAQAE